MLSKSIFTLIVCGFGGAAGFDSSFLSSGFWLLSSPFGLPVFRFLFLSLLLVTLRRQWRRIGLRKHQQIDAPRHGPAEALDIGLERGPRIRAGCEIQVFAVFVEDRVARIAHAVGHLSTLGVRERVQ